MLDVASVTYPAARVAHFVRKDGLRAATCVSEGVTSTHDYATAQPEVRFRHPLGKRRNLEAVGKYARFKRQREVGAALRHARAPAELEVRRRVKPGGNDSS